MRAALTSSRGRFAHERHTWTPLSGTCETVNNLFGGVLVELACTHLRHALQTLHMLPEELHRHPVALRKGGLEDAHEVVRHQLHTEFPGMEQAVEVGGGGDQGILLGGRGVVTRVIWAHLSHDTARFETQILLRSATIAGGCDIRSNKDTNNKDYVNVAESRAPRRLFREPSPCVAQMCVLPTLKKRNLVVTETRAERPRAAKARALRGRHTAMSTNQRKCPGRRSVSFSPQILQ